MPFKDPQKRREYQNKWGKNNRIKKREWNRQLRIKVLIKLGGKCVNCGCNDLNALEINHINGGGRQEQIKKYNRSHRAFLYAILLGKRPTNDLEITCKVCNSLHYLKEIKKVKGNWKIKYTGGM